LAQPASLGASDTLRHGTATADLTANQMAPLQVYYEPQWKGEQ